MKEKIKKMNRNQFVEDIQTCLITLVILVIFVLLYFLLEPLLGEVAGTVIFGFFSFIAAGAFYYFITRLIRIIGRIFKKKKLTDFGKP